MKYKVGDKVRAIVSDPRIANTIVTITDAFFDKDMDIQYYITQDTNGEKWGFSEDELEPADSKILRMADGTIIGDFSTGGFCDGFRGGKIPSDLIISHTEMERAMDRLLKALEKPNVKFGIKKLEQKLKEEKNLKFTFYAKEGTRPDKKCNGTIPTMTTNIELFDGNVFDYVTTIRGSATCDKADYDERQGVLEALANAVCGGEFEKRYSKAVKANKDADLWLRTCHYCGQVLDTREEREAHEAWHVERKKARRERYLLRKRAKEIAFEEQAQKMAKEMIEK